MRKKNPISITPLLCLTLTAVLLGGVSASAVFAAEVDIHPVFALYPSSEELRATVEAMKLADPEGFEAARRDFDLAIRSRFVLTPPKLPDERTPHGPSSPSLGSLWAKPGLDLVIESIEEKPGGRARAQFYRDHYDEYIVIETPALRTALADVVLNGWHDWSAWEGKKLTTMREVFPELHRTYALGLARYFQIKDYNGLALRMLVAASTPEYVRKRAASLLKRVDNNLDVLGFVVTRMEAAEDGVVKDSLRSCIQAISEDVRPYERRTFWKAYIDSTDEHLRKKAVLALGSAARQIRILSAGADLSPEIMAKLQESAKNDSDQRIRESAGRAVRRMESEPFRGYSPRPREQGNPEE